MTVKASIITSTGEVEFNQQLSDLINGNQRGFYFKGYRVYFEDSLLELIDLVDEFENGISMVFKPI